MSRPPEKRAARSILFLDKVLLTPKPDVVRGVELFNLNLVRDLAGVPCSVTVPIHGSWQRAFGGPAAGRQPVLLKTGLCGNALLNGVWAAYRLRRTRFAVLLLGNVAKSLIPAVRMLHRFRTCPRAVVIAHREPAARFLLAQRRMPTTVVAVNGKIAGHFERTGFSRVDVSYGVTDAEAFHPAPAGQGRKETIDFCVLGQLDNAWKGADTAAEAFGRLPAELRARARLHLAAFAAPPAFADPNIIAYSWLRADRIPEFLREMDVMLLPSRDEEVMRETFSQAMVQGMLSGLPVVANDLPILTEKLDAGGGLVFRTIDELAQAMQKLANEPELRAQLGAQARRTALARYVWDSGAFAERYLFPEDS